ncbi:MAG: hypothetical protein RLZZ200_2872 [Pseudomonadota bacterium]|jgi:hypothetical protein
MSTIFCRPGHLHTASRILSCSQEAGLTVAPPTPTSTNTGALRLRTSGTPSAVIDAVVRVLTGGNPTGDAAPDATSKAVGTAVAWRNTTDSTSQYRGYEDSIYLMRAQFPFAPGGANYGLASTPRTLPDGSLGVLINPVAGGANDFSRFGADGTLLSSALVFGSTVIATARRRDFVVLPSGRLVAGANQGTTIDTQFSDDYGITWTSYGTSPATVGYDVFCMEAVDDLVVAVATNYAGGVAAQIYVSTDGGATFALVDTGPILSGNSRTCVTLDGIVLLCGIPAAGPYPLVYPITPGGGFDSGLPISVGFGGNAVNPSAIVCREDGVVYVIGLDVNVGGVVRMLARVSYDGGATFQDPYTGIGYVMDAEVAAYATGGYTALSAGIWHGHILMLARTDSSGSTDGMTHLLEWGGWESVTDTRTSSFAHTYLPIDYPQNLGWTRADVGAGATLTTIGPLRIDCSAGGVNSHFQSVAAMWAPVAGDARTVEFRFRVVTAGDADKTTNRQRLQLAITDGANQQVVNIRFSGTDMAAYDTAGAQIGATLTIDLTRWTELKVAFRHDWPSAGAGRVAIYYKQDSLAATQTSFMDTTLWTTWIVSSNVPEGVGVTNNVLFGGSQASTIVWEVAYLGISDVATNLIVFSNPRDLTGHPLSPTSDTYMVSGLAVGGYNGDASPSDTYDVDTTYNYGKENIWRELRPSRQVRSTATGAAWNVVFDAGANDQFKGDLVALFGTNFRTATLQLHTANAWGAPAVSVPLDATITQFAVGAGVRGPGYVGPATSRNWRPGQFRSDTDAHRWFVELGNSVYEIQDNDEDRIYVANADLSAAAGTAYIFGDRMGAAFSFAQYRYARVLVGAQSTADSEYRLGTVVLDKAFTPKQTYDHGFVERIEPNVEVFEGESGYRMSARVGPRRHTLAIQWPPMSRKGGTSDVELRIANFFAALEGANRPIVVWRDTNDQTTLTLCRVTGKYSATNVWGELANAVTRIDQIVLEEEL